MDMSLDLLALPAEHPSPLVDSSANNYFDRSSTGTLVIMGFVLFLHKDPILETHHIGTIRE